MMEQQTLSNQQTNVERAALFPPEEKPTLTTSDVIIIGEDSLAAASIEASKEEGAGERLEVATVEQMFNGFYDSYVAFANDPSPTYVYHLPKKYRFDTEVRIEHNRAEVAEQKRQDLIKYARVAFVNGDIQLQPDNVPFDAPITVDTIAEAIVTDGIMRAQDRYDEARAGFDATDQPGHISVEQDSESAEDKASFMELVKSFGARAFHSLNLHSGEVTLPPTRTLPTVAIDYTGAAQK